MNLRNTITKSFFTLWLLLSQSVFAQSNISESGWSVSVALGAGMRTNPIIDSEDIPIFVIPQISYQGERFFIQNLDIGYTLFQTDTQQLNVLVTPSYDQVFFNRWDANNFFNDSNGLLQSTNKYPTVEFIDRSINKNKLHKRKMAALAGFEYSTQIKAVDIQLQGLHEVSGNYSGDEFRLAISKAVNLGKSDIKFTLGANWQSKKTLMYFYGLTEQETNIDTVYSPSSGTTTLMRLDWGYPLSDKWDLKFFTSYRHLSEPIVNSPLVAKDTVITTFVGGVYHF